MTRKLFIPVILLGLLAACSRDERADLPPAWYRPEPSLFPGPGHIDPDDGFRANLAAAEAADIGAPPCRPGMCDS